MRPRAEPRLASRRLVPVGQDTKAGTLGTAEAVEAAARLAGLLQRDHLGLPVATLEAIAATLANRVRRVGPDVAGLPPLAEAPAAGPSLRRIARRALADALRTPVGRATRYHPEGAEPPWARGRLPVAELGGFLFHEFPEAREE